MPPRDVPILLLDVDGVLNATRVELPEGWREAGSPGSCCRGTRRSPPGCGSCTSRAGWSCSASPPPTTDADALLAEPMGLPRGLTVHDREDAAPSGFPGRLGGLSGWWKLAAARSVAEAEPGRRIVWIDDDLAEQAEDTGEWLAAHPQLLVVAPHLEEGLTHEQLDEAEAWP